MKFTLFFLASFCFVQMSIVAQVNIVSCAEADSLIRLYEGNKRFIIIDNRYVDAYNSGHIAGAINMDVNDEDVDEQISQLRKWRRTYLIYCTSHRRADRFTGKMKAQGFKNVYYMREGVLEWENQGYPLVQ